MFKTVRSKFTLGYLSLVLVICFLGVVSIYTMSSISTTIEGLITTNYNSIDRLNRMTDALWGQRMAVEEYLNGDSVQAAIRFEQYRNEFIRYYNEEEATIILDNERQYIDEIWQRFQRYVSSFQILTSYDISNPEEYSQAVDYHETNMSAYVTLLENAMQKLHDSNETALFSRRDQATEAARTSTRALCILFPLAAVLGLWMSNIYTKRFLAPIDQITRQIKLVRQGNLTSGELVTSQDEFGLLADEFRRMLQRLSDFEQSTLGSLMEAKNQTDTIAKSINEPLLVLDDKGAVLLLNQAMSQLAGVDESASIHMPVRQLLPKGELADYLLRVLQGSSDVEPEKIVALADNDSDHFYHVAITPILDADERTTGFIVLLHNVTELKLLEKARGDFIATISHEFKTPLTSIFMGADMMRSELAGPMNRDQREIVETICEDSQQLENLVSELLELSRIESAKTIYKFEPCSVESAIRVSTRQFESIAVHSEIRLTTQVPKDLPQVCADFSKITWVLNNLLSNAMKYTNEGCSVTVSAQRRERDILISVADTGIGVPPEFADQIFEKFVQVKGYDLEVRGTGLGLAAAKEIITAHHGRIWCVTDREEGSEFCFTLPLIKEENHDGTKCSDCG